MSTTAGRSDTYTWLAGWAWGSRRCYLLGAVIYRLTAKRPEIDELAAGSDRDRALAGRDRTPVLRVHGRLTSARRAAAMPRSSSAGRRLYAIVALFGIYWIEIQVASLVRVRREGKMGETEVPTSEARLLEAGIEASSFYWAYFVAIGVLAYIVLYLV